MRRAAVRQDGVDREHVLARVAVAQRARAARIVARHAADGGARGGGDIDREPEAVGLEGAVEVVEHDAGLDGAAPARDVEVEHAVQIFRAVDHQRPVDRLPALRGSAAARQHGDALLARERDGALGLGEGARQHDPKRHHLVLGGVGGVAPAGERVEADFACDFRFEPAFEPRHQHGGHTSLSLGSFLFAHVLVGEPLSTCRDPRADGPMPAPKGLTDIRIRHSWRQAAGSRAIPLF